jgi:hypothetical protein
MTGGWEGERAWHRTFKSGLCAFGYENTLYRFAERALPFLLLMPIIWQESFRLVMYERGFHPYG